MTRSSLCLLVLTSGCLTSGRFGIAAEPPTPIETTTETLPPAQPAVATTRQYGDGEDIHWLQADDFLVSSTPYENKKLELSVAKMTSPAGTHTKAEAQFLLASGEQVWTTTYYRTRIATREDLKIGVLAICFGKAYETKSERPQNKAEARNGRWILAPITDVADLYKGRVTVANDSCSLDSIRVPN